MENENDKKLESIYSKRLRAGKRRTYFFDIRATKGNDYYLTITESRKRSDDSGYDRHKVFLYKEDFNKFVKALSEAVDYVKTDLMPDFDFDAFSHEGYEDGEYENNTAHKTVTAPVPIIETVPETTVVDVADVPEAVVTIENDNTINPTHHEEVDKW